MVNKDVHSVSQSISVYRLINTAGNYAITPLQPTWLRYVMSLYAPIYDISGMTVVIKETAGLWLLRSTVKEKSIRWQQPRGHVNGGIYTA